MTKNNKNLAYYNEKDTLIDNMTYEICKLDISDFEKCANIWKMEEHKELAEKFLYELKNGNRITYIYKESGSFLGKYLLFLMREIPITLKRINAYIFQDLL